MVKLKDIAEDVGVSISMVSRALNPNPDRKVSPKLKERVLRSAEKFGFKRNRTAEFLKRGRSPVLGVFIPGHADRLVADLMIGISKKAASLGFPLNFYFSTRLAAYREDFEKFISGVMENSNSGIITYAYDEIEKGEISKLLDAYVSSGGKAIILNTHRNFPGIPKVTNDDFMGGRLAAKHLVSRNTGVLLCENSVFFKRTEGFVHEAAKHGIEPVLYDMDSFDCQLKKARGKAGARPVGVFACMDINAAEILKRVKRTGSRVGSDVLLIGYDDLEFCSFTDPRLTTVRQNFLTEGERVVEKLVNVIYGGHENEESVPVELVVRESA